MAYFWCQGRVVLWYAHVIEQILSVYIKARLWFSKFCSISPLSCSFECGGGGWVLFPAISLSQPNYSYGCFVVGVVIGL